MFYDNLYKLEFQLHFYFEVILIFLPGSNLVLQFLQLCQV